MTTTTAQSRYSDPGRHAGLLGALPDDLDSIAAAARNVLVHYRYPGEILPAERMPEIDNRWVERILETDQARHPVPLTEPRAVADRVLGCCRDFTLLTVAGLRQRGVRARSRVGFARYLGSGWHYDHVVVELPGEPRPVGARLYDSQFSRADVDNFDVPFDPTEIPRGLDGFASAAEVWTGYRRGELDVDEFGVAPELPPLRGAWFVRNYVLLELAHRFGDELLLWDMFGTMGGPVEPDDLADLDLIDDVAALLLAADRGDTGAEAELRRRYASDPRLHPADSVRTYSPTGTTYRVDLATREATPLPAEETFTV